MQTLSMFQPKGCPSLRNQRQKRTMPEIGHLSCGGCFNRPISALSCAMEEEITADSNLEAAGRDSSLEETEEDAIEKEDGGKAARLNVQALARRLWDSKSADDVEEVLGGIRAIHPCVHSSMIKGLGMDKKLDAALALVEWLKRNKSGEKGASAPNAIIYNSLLGAIRQSGDYGRAELVVEDMAEQGILPDIITYNTLMHISIERGEPDEARRLLARIKEKGISPSAATYSTALLAYQKSGDASGALEFFLDLRDAFERGEMARSGDEEDWKVELAKLQNFTLRICYQVIRQWLVNGENQTTRILELFSDLDMAGLSGGRVELEKLAWACTMEYHHIVARELYTRIRNLESGISLSVCNHIIWLMGKAKKWWAALEIYEDLLDKGPKPNNLSYELIVSHFNVLLSAAKKRGIWRWGLRILTKMQEKGLRPGAREWNAVLLACSKASETRAAVQIFKRMLEYGEKPTIVSYGALLSALEKGELYDEALRVWDHMCRMGIEPNLYAYTILACVYIGSGRFELVDSVIRDMSSAGIEPTVVTFNAIISGCARRNLGSAALEWFHRMKVRNTAPNEITYEMLIEALTREGKVRLAYEMYLRGCKEGLALSSKAYDAVARCCVGHGGSLDLDVLGPRPSGKKTLAHLPRRGQSFELVGKKFSL